jgi:hypothetical protein
MQLSIGSLDQCRNRASILTVVVVVDSGINVLYDGTWHEEMTRREEDDVVVIIIVDAPLAFGRRAWWSSGLGYVKGIGIGRKSKARIEEVFHLDLARNLGREHK